MTSLSKSDPPALIIPSDLGRLRVIAGRMGLPQDTYSHLPPEEEKRTLVEYLTSLLAALARQGMTLEQYVAVVDMKTNQPGVDRFPVTPIGRRRGGLV